MSSPQLQEQLIYNEEDYWSLPDGIRAELIDGRFYNMTPPSRKHQKILSKLHQTIANYIDGKGGSCEVYPAPFAVRLDKDDKTIVEPDLSVICNPDKLTDKGCDGAPDWIIEIVSPGNPSHDYVLKLNKYLSAGVREYWIVDQAKETIFVYFFEITDFDVTTYSFKDILRVNIFEDFSIDFTKLNI